MPGKRKITDIVNVPFGRVAAAVVDGRGVINRNLRKDTRTRLKCLRAYYTRIIDGCEAHRREVNQRLAEIKRMESE